MFALKDKMAALNNKYSVDAGFICKCAAEVQLKVFCNLCLEEFMTHLINVIEKKSVIKNESSFHFSFLFPEIDGDHDKKFFTIKTFVNLIQAPTSEAVNEAIFMDYFDTACKELVSIMFG
jgi:hypothetical protein